MIFKFPPTPLPFIMSTHILRILTSETPLGNFVLSVYNEERSKDRFDIFNFYMYTVPDKLREMSAELIFKEREKKLIWDRIVFECDKDAVLFTLRWA